MPNSLIGSSSHRIIGRTPNVNCRLSIWRHFNRHFVPLCADGLSVASMLAKAFAQKQLGKERPALWKSHAFARFHS